MITIIPPEIPAQRWHHDCVHGRRLRQNSGDYALTFVVKRRAAGDADKCMVALVKRAVRAYMMVIASRTEEAARVASPSAVVRGMRAPLGF